MKSGNIIKIVAIVLGIAIIVLIGLLIFIPAAKGPTITTPAAIISPDGRVAISLPHENDVIASPAAIEGTVTGGGWFFEASFPIKIVDADGTVLGEGIAQALSDWMSTGTVPFSASIPFTTPHSATGMIIFSKDNPSGAPENAASFSMPISFESGVTATSTQTATIGSGTVNGKVILGPTCPVESIPPNPQCAPKPYQTSVLISKNIETPTAFKTISTNPSGTFSVSLAPGEYDFYIQGASPYPRCTEQLVTVSAGKTSDITINCDTGIR